MRFACQHDLDKKDIIGEVTIPQFSAAVVPQVLVHLYKRVICSSFQYILHVELSVLDSAETN